MTLFFIAYKQFIERSKVIIIYNSYLGMKFRIGICNQNYLKDVIIVCDKLKTPTTFAHINY